MELEGLIVHVYKGTAYAYQVDEEGKLRRVTRDGYRYFKAANLNDFREGVAEEVINLADYDLHNDSDALAYVGAVATMDRVAKGKDN